MKIGAKYGKNHADERLKKFQIRSAIGTLDEVFAPAKANTLGLMFDLFSCAGVHGQSFLNK